jgi:hypothetical protein
VPGEAQNHSAVSWIFTTARDAEDYGLSQEQCRSAFPKLFVEIEKAVEARRGKMITFEELDLQVLKAGMVRAMVFHGDV